MARCLRAETEHYEKSTRSSAASALTEEGQCITVEALLREHGILDEGSLYDVNNMLASCTIVQQGLRAHVLYKRDKSTTW